MIWIQAESIKLLMSLFVETVCADYLLIERTLLSRVPTCFHLAVVRGSPDFSPKNKQISPVLFSHISSASLLIRFCYFRNVTPSLCSKLKLHAEPWGRCSRSLWEKPKAQFLLQSTSGLVLSERVTRGSARVVLGKGSLLWGRELTSAVVFVELLLLDLSRSCTVKMSASYFCPLKK